jgi:hypothetical protein
MVAENAEQIVDVPVGRIFGAMACDQRHVGRTEIELQPAPNAAGVVLANPALDVGRGQDAVAERARQFGAKRQSIEATEITMPDIAGDVVGEIILEVDLVEEAGPDVII